MIGFMINILYHDYKFIIISDLKYDKWMVKVLSGKTIPCYIMSYKIGEASSKVWLWLARNHRTAAASTLACRRGWSLSRLRRGPRTANFDAVCVGAFAVCLGHTANSRNPVV